MTYRWNVFTRNFDIDTRTSSPGGSGQITNLSLVFYEEFTGDGVSTVFTLDGSVDNATWSTGSWLYNRVATTLPSHVTKENGKALYDRTNIFTRNRIYTESINATNAEVTLTYAPINGQVFRIWYWYTLYNSDVLSYYYRPEFVASMEGDISSSDVIAAQNVNLNTANFNKILSNTEDTVQKAMDILDDHTHTGLPIDPDTHRVLDQLVHDLDENHYQEYIYNGWQIDACIVWDSSSKNVKIREFLYTYSGIQVITEVINQYDSTGTLVNTLTFSYTYTDSQITSVDCVRS
jgi:hypothetical protein